MRMSASKILREKLMQGWKKKGNESQSGKKRQLYILHPQKSTIDRFPKYVVSGHLVSYGRAGCIRNELKVYMCCLDIERGSLKGCSNWRHMRALNPPSDHPFLVVKKASPWQHLVYLPRSSRFSNFKHDHTLCPR